MTRNDGDEELVTECVDCGRTFGFIVRRNKCHVCKNVFCGKCVNYRIYVNGHEEKQRVCERCKEDFLCNSQKPESCPQLQRAIKKGAISSSLPIPNSLEVEDQAAILNKFGDDKASVSYKRKLPTFGKENMPLSAVNAVRAAKESERRQFSDILSCLPAAITVSMLSPQDATDQINIRQPITETITPPTTRRGFAAQPEFSPDRSRKSHEPNASTKKSHKEDLSPAVSTMQAPACSDVNSGVIEAVEDCSCTDIGRSGLRNAPESPLLPLRRSYRDPVPGKYIDERDLLIDESGGDELDQYVVYDSDLDRTFEQLGSPAAKTAAIVSQGNTEPESPSTGQSMAPVHAKRNPQTVEVEAPPDVHSQLPNHLSPVSDGVTPAARQASSPLLRSVPDNNVVTVDVYEECSPEKEDAESGGLETESALSYHVIITSLELMTSSTEAVAVDPPPCGQEVAQSIPNPEEKTRKRLLPTLRPKKTITVSSTANQEEAYGSFLRTPPRAHHRGARGMQEEVNDTDTEDNVSMMLDHDHYQLFKAMSPEKFSFSRVLISMLVLLVLAVVVPTASRLSGRHTSFTTTKLHTTEEGTTPTLVTHLDSIHFMTSSQRSILSADKAIGDEDVLVADESKASPKSGDIIASTLTLHIGLQGYQASCSVHTDRKRQQDLVEALSKSRPFLVEIENELEERNADKESMFSSLQILQTDHPSEKALVIRDFVQHQKDALLRAMRKLAAIPKTLSRVILGIVRGVIGLSQKGP